MTITYYPEITQGSDEWHSLRCGTLTASSINAIITPTLKLAKNDKSRAHIDAMMAQRITKYTEPSYMNDDMLRGWDDEITARDLYSEKYERVEQTGFITNDKWGFKIGYSPDGLVGKKGLIEIKSRLMKFQIDTIISQDVPLDYTIQIQTGLLVSEREWCDYISYSGGLPMVTLRVFPDLAMQDAIVNAAAAFEAELALRMIAYSGRLASDARLLPTERRKELEMHL